MNEKITILKNSSIKPIRHRLLIGTPTLGVIRMEWAHSRWMQVVPTNWAAVNTAVGYSHTIPMGYLVADAQNILTQTAVEQNFEWMLLLEDDVCMPANAFLIYNEYMKKGDTPVVSGLYYLKTSPSEPLIYRGRGNGPYENFKIGDLVWADGVPTGCLLIHCSILRLMWEESEWYVTGNNVKVKKVWETPAKVWFDPETHNARFAAGTSDLYWCDRVRNENILEKSGWKKIAKKKYPFLVDTNIFCRHVDLSTGVQYPIEAYNR